MQLAEVQRREVALAVESVEVGSQCRVAPDPLGGNGCATLLRRGSNCYDGEAVAHGLEGLVSEDRCYRLTSIRQVVLHLILRVALSDKCYMDRSLIVLGCLQGGVGRGPLLAEWGHQYITRVYALCHRGDDVVAIIPELETNLHRLLRHGDEKDILKGFPTALLRLRIA